MKNSYFYTVLALLGCLCLLNACHISGTSYEADKASGYAEAFKLIQKNVDTRDAKIYYMKFEGSEENGNKLESVTIKAVTKSNMAYSQKILLTGAQQALEMEDIARTFEAPVYTDVKGINFETFTAQTIEDQINQAKKKIPEGCKFKGINNYCFSETVPAGNESLNNGEELGKQNISFSMSIIMKQPGGQEGFGVVRCIVVGDSVKLDV